jgi:hypothetical protein
MVERLAVVSDEGVGTSVAVLVLPCTGAGGAFGGTKL